MRTWKPDAVWTSLWSIRVYFGLMLIKVYTMCGQCWSHVGSVLDDLVQSVDIWDDPGQHFRCFMTFVNDMLGTTLRGTGVQLKNICAKQTVNVFKINR